MLKILIILSIFFQEKSIIVVDFESKEPIPGVVILFGENKTTTNSNGKFQVPNAGESLIILSLLPKKSTTV